MTELSDFAWLIPALVLVGAIAVAGLLRLIPLPVSADARRVGPGMWKGLA